MISIAVLKSNANRLIVMPIRNVVEHDIDPLEDAAAANRADAYDHVNAMFCTFLDLEREQHVIREANRKLRKAARELKKISRRI